MGVLILVNYSPIWSCEPLWESRWLYLDAWTVPLIELTLKDGIGVQTMSERVSTVELYCVDPQLSRNWTSDRSCSLWIPDISLMEPLDHDEYVVKGP